MNATETTLPASVPFYTVLSISDLRRLLRNATALAKAQTQADVSLRVHCISLRGAINTSADLRANDGACQVSSYDMTIRSVYDHREFRALSSVLPESQLSA